MSNSKIFFSYSRENSDFVLNLAKELREAGAEVWLDQLDIKPGSRWDKSIESALKNASTLLVILSKSSVASNNVMDEVSYALEEGKEVVPVLLEECEIPFRLRRLQFADFSGSHKQGLATLTRALHLDEDVSSKLVGEASNKEAQQPMKPEMVSPVAEPIDVKAPEAVKPVAQAPSRSSGSKKTLLYGLIAVVAVVGIYYVYSTFSGAEDHSMDMMAQCKADWEEMETAVATEPEEINQLAALRRHIELYAPCPHEDEAMDRISFLKAMGGDAFTTIEEEDGDEEITSEDTGSRENLQPTNTSGTSNTNIGNSGTQNTAEPEVIVEQPDPVLEVTGKNVKMVVHNAGMFYEHSPKKWMEISENGERLFDEIKRTRNAVFLREGNDVNLLLDLNRNAIFYSDANTEQFQLYTIISVSDVVN